MGPPPPGVGGPPAPRSPRKKTGSDKKTGSQQDAKRNRKKKRKQITCLNPYACDQSEFWPKGGGVSVYGEMIRGWIWVGLGIWGVICLL